MLSKSWKMTFGLLIMIRERSPEQKVQWSVVRSTHNYWMKQLLALILFKLWRSVIVLPSSAYLKVRLHLVINIYFILWCIYCDLFPFLLQYFFFVNFNFPLMAISLEPCNVGVIMINNTWQSNQGNQNNHDLGQNLVSSWEHCNTS